jgi:hypothetical protein
MMRSASSRRRGAEAIEFALVMPVFITVSMAMMDLAWLFYTESSLDVSTHIGCRAGALIDPGLGEANLAEVHEVTSTALVQAMSAQGLPDCAERCQAQVGAVGSNPSRTLTCAVDYTFTPLLGMGLAELELSSTQVVRMEWQRG